MNAADAETGGSDEGVAEEAEDGVDEAVGREGRSGEDESPWICGVCSSGSVSISIAWLDAWSGECLMDSAWLGSMGKGLVKLFDWLDEFVSVDADIAKKTFNDVPNIEAHVENANIIQAISV